MSKKDPFPNPLQALEHGSLPTVSVLASTVFPTRGFGRQDSDMITSSLDQVISRQSILTCFCCLFHLTLVFVFLQVAKTVSDLEVVRPLESGSLISLNEPFPPWTDLSLVAFDMSFFKSQLGKFCDQIADPIPLVSSNPLENLEHLESVQTSKFSVLQN